MQQRQFDPWQQEAIAISGGRHLVSTLCERFKEEFGGTLRVLNICFLY
jgi:hypothetical protein